MTIGLLLRVLFSLMLMCVVGALLLPIYDDLQQRTTSGQVVDNARAARVVFTALQNLRTERGPTRTTLEGKDPASPSFLSLTATVRAASTPAVAAALQQCGVVHCGKPEVLAGLPAAVAKLEAIRKDVDTALRVPLSERRPNVAKEFNAAATDVIDRFEDMSKVLAEMVRMADAETAELIEIKELAWTARDGVGLERNLLSEGKALSPADLKRVTELRARAELAWPFVRDLVARSGVPSDVVAAVTAAHEQAFGSYEKTRKAVFDALTNNKPMPVSREEIIVGSTAAVDALGNVSNTAMAAAERQGQLKHEQANRALAVHCGLLGIAFLVGVAGFVVVQGCVTRPVGAMTRTMRRLADGDITVQIPGTARRDELGDMAKAVEVFKQNAIEQQRLAAEREQAKERAAAERRTEMHKLADDFQAAVGVIVEAVSSSATELEASAGMLGATAEKTRELAGVVAVASEEASSNVQSASASTEEMTSSVQEIGRRVDQSSSIAREAVTQAEKTDASITELSQAAQRIGDVVKLITAIAEQTNLLALNATIEAARAGEAGRGFAVVASEVKSLASQTAKATEEIGSQIAGMQNATRDAVAAIRGIGGTIGRISELSASIAAAIEQQTAATHEIARNVHEAAKGTSEVAGTISDVNRGASETGAASSQLLASAQTLAKQGSRLRAEVEKFLVNVRAA
jgi:methyl-accepting chemotaxis protein